MMNKLRCTCSRSVWWLAGRSCRSAIIINWLANNVWTFGQQHYVFGKIQHEEEAKKLEAVERRAADAPLLGAKPKTCA